MVLCYTVKAAQNKRKEQQTCAGWCFSFWCFHIKHILGMWLGALKGLDWWVMAEHIPVLNASATQAADADFGLPVLKAAGMAWTLTKPP